MSSDVLETLSNEQQAAVEVGFRDLFGKVLPPPPDVEKVGNWTVAFFVAAQVGQRVADLRVEFMLLQVSQAAAFAWANAVIAVEVVRFDPNNGVVFTSEELAAKCAHVLAEFTGYEVEAME